MRTGFHYLISLSVVYRLSSPYFRIITDWEESFTWPISTSPAFAEAGELGLTRGACFVVRRTPSRVGRNQTVLLWFGGV